MPNHSTIKASTLLHDLVFASGVRPNEIPFAEDKKGNPCAGSVQFAASSNFADHEVNAVKNRHWQPG